MVAEEVVLAAVAGVAVAVVATEEAAITAEVVVVPTQCRWAVGGGDPACPF